MGLSVTELSHLTNPLVTPLQLDASSIQLDGISADLEASVRFQTARLMQAAGVLLRLPQELVAQAIIIVSRYWVSADGGGLTEYDAQDIATAALYLTAKPSPNPVTPKQVILVCNQLSNLDTNDYSETSHQTPPSDTTADHLTVEQYTRSRDQLYCLETLLLRTLGFQTHVALPYSLSINYLQTLSCFQLHSTGSQLARRVFSHLNTALLSPQLLYLTHQPPALATAAIYLAARELEIKLPETEWWEVFDVEREELGFLVVALLSVEGFARRESEVWGRRKVPMTRDAIRMEMDRIGVSEGGGE